jgi:Flp pilus assembly protein TadG
MKAHSKPLAGKRDPGGQSPPRYAAQRPPRSRRGVALIYTIFLMMIMLAMISLAVDYARVQLVKTQLQRLADATARGGLQIYTDSGASAAATYEPMLATSSFNPVDVNSGIQPTVTPTSGYWTPSTKTFSASSGTLVAVKATATRTAQNGNAVPLTFSLLSALGFMKTTCNVTATAIAALQPAVTNTVTVPGTADLWLSGMPAGSTASYNDTEAADPAVLGLNVTPGTVLSFSATGQTAQNSSLPYYPAEGHTAISNRFHMEYSPDGDYNGLQNGIQTITAPEVGLLGVFLNAYQPSTQTPPASGLDYSTSSSQNQTSYTALQLQQPFYIGNGQTNGSVTQSFLVPAGVTRLYLATFEPYQNNDNLGSLTVTVTQQAVVYLVQ